MLFRSGTAARDVPSRTAGEGLSMRHRGRPPSRGTCPRFVALSATGQRKNASSPGRRRAFRRVASSALKGAWRTHLVGRDRHRHQPDVVGLVWGIPWLLLGRPLPPGAAGPAPNSRGACSRHNNARDRHSGNGRRHGCNKGCLEQRNRCGRSRRRHSRLASRRCDRTSDNARRL